MSQRGSDSSFSKAQKDAEKPAVVAEKESPEGETDISDSETDDTPKRGGSANKTMRNMVVGGLGLYWLVAFCYAKFIHKHGIFQSVWAPVTMILPATWGPDFGYVNKDGEKVWQNKDVALKEENYSRTYQPDGGIFDGNTNTTSYPSVNLETGLVTDIDTTSKYAPVFKEEGGSITGSVKLEKKDKARRHEVTVQLIWEKATGKVTWPKDGGKGDVAVIPKKIDPQTGEITYGGVFKKPAEIQPDGKYRLHLTPDLELKKEYLGHHEGKDDKFGEEFRRKREISLDIPKGDGTSQTVKLDFQKYTKGDTKEKSMETYKYPNGETHDLPADFSELSAEEKAKQQTIKEAAEKKKEERHKIAKVEDDGRYRYSGKSYVCYITFHAGEFHDDKEEDQFAGFKRQKQTITLELPTHVEGGTETVKLTFIKFYKGDTREPSGEEEYEYPNGDTHKFPAKFKSTKEEG